MAWGKEVRVDIKVNASSLEEYLQALENRARDFFWHPTDEEVVDMLLALERVNGATCP